MSDGGFYPGFGVFMNEYEAESDRGSAILTLCVLEEALVLAIKKRLPAGPNSDNQDSWKHMAPPGRLSVTVQNAYLLGLLNKEHLHNFQKLIKVRNQFAHNAISGLRYTDRNISSWIRDIKMDVKPVKLGPRNKFLIAAAEIYMTLHHLTIERLSPLVDEGRTIRLVEIESPQN